MSPLTEALKTTYGSKSGPGGPHGLQNRCEAVILSWVGSIPTYSRQLQRQGFQGSRQLHLQVADEGPEALFANILQTWSQKSLRQRCWYHHCLGVSLQERSPGRSQVGGPLLLASREGHGCTRQASCRSSSVPGARSPPWMGYPATAGGSRIRVIGCSGTFCVLVPLVPCASGVLAFCMCDPGGRYWLLLRVTSTDD